MFEQLFGSKTRVKLLYMFYGNTNRSFYVREITRKIDEQINSVRRELANLLSIGIIKSETNNNRLYYEVNQEYEHYQAFLMIFGSGNPQPAESTDADVETTQTASTDEPIVKQLRTAGKIDLAILTGQFTRDTLSGIDLLVVGDINATAAANVIEELEQSEKKSIAYTLMPTAEYTYRRQINDRFLSAVLLSKKQVIINDRDLSVDVE